MTLPPVMVQATPLPHPSTAPQAPDGSTATTAYRVSPSGMQLLGSPAGTNAYSMVSGLPGIKVGTIDPYGAANIPGGNKGFRVRGINTSHGAYGTVEGLPMMVVNPGPNYLWMFDAENVAEMRATQGPTPPDRMGFFSVGGSLDTGLLWPQATAQRQVSASAGSFDFRRLFARLDTGEFAGDTRLFLSASDASASKWRGPGDSPDHRTNAAVALSRSAGDLAMKFMVVNSDMAQDNYRPLNYAQASDLDRYNRFDYDATPSSVAAQRYNYYRYNRQSFTDTAFISELAYRFNPDTQVVVKPFYFKEHGHFLDGQASNTVREWLVDHDSYGLTAELQARLADTPLKFGYWLTSAEPPGPPTAWKSYATSPSGDLRFSSWSLLAKVVDRHEFSSFYATGSHQFGPLRVEGGARYAVEKLPSIDVYNSARLGNVSYDEALSRSSGVVANRSARGRTLTEWLPYLGLSYAVTSATDIKLAAGRSIGAPSFDVWPTFQSNPTRFLSRGVTAQMLWDRIRPELDDGVDLGLQVNFDKGYVAPTIYYTRFKHRSVNFYDPVVGAAYSQNVGEGHTTGAQVAAAWNPLDSLSLFGSLSYNRAVFDEDVLTAGGATLRVSGQQLPDAPKRMATLGLTWKPGKFSVSPILHYQSERYGDSGHQERVPSFTTVDLQLGYQEKLGWGSLDVTLALLNAFDRKYISLINASDVQGTGGIGYYPGAPRTLMAKVGLNF